MEHQIDWECFFDQLPDFEEVADFLQEDVINPPVSIADTPSPNPCLSEIENLLMTDSDEGIASPEDS
ncbi:bZIP transcription factor, partial [Trifolium medium]|nr:bZIP transcription factor [Trifolium medium]